MRRLWIAAILTAVLVGLPLWAINPLDPRTRTLFMEPYGSITAGRHFGVAIGDAEAEADAKLRRLLRPTYVQRDGPDSLSAVPDIPRGEAVIFNRDKSWRNGVVSVVVAKGRVIAIAWSYVGPFYLDF